MENDPVDSHSEFSRVANRYWLAHDALAAKIAAGGMTPEAERATRDVMRALSACAHCDPDDPPGSVLLGILAERTAALETAMRRG